MKKLYIAAPLFSVSELELNSKLKKLLSDYFQIFLPQDDAGKIVDLVKDDQPDKVGAEIFGADIRAMNDADIILAVLDGRTVDEGACFELGYMFASGKECYGFQTDIRRPYLTGNNPMVQYSCKKIFHSFEELEDWAKNY